MVGNSPRGRGRTRWAPETLARRGAAPNVILTSSLSWGCLESCLDAKRQRYSLDPGVPGRRVGPTSASPSCGGGRGCARLLKIPNHGVQQREINHARDENGDGDFEISSQCWFGRPDCEPVHTVDSLILEPAALQDFDPAGLSAWGSRATMR